MHNDSPSILSIIDTTFEVVMVAAPVVAGCMTIAALRPTHPIGRALRTLNREQRRGAAFLVLMTLLIIIPFLAHARFQPASAALDSGCDDTLFSALHPQLGTLDHSQQAFARRFVVLLREVSPSVQCNARALREALQSAHSAVLDELSTPRKVPALGNFAALRTENVSVVLDSVEPRGADQWQLRWTEHVHAPSGEPLRTAQYAAELGLSQSSAASEVTAFHMRPESIVSVANPLPPEVSAGAEP